MGEVWEAAMRRAMAVRAVTSEPLNRQHGTPNSYSAGCRCASCTRAKADYKRAQRAVVRRERQARAASLRAVIEAESGKASGELLALIEDQLQDMRRGDFAPKWEVYLDAPLPSGTSSLHDRIADAPRRALEWEDPTYELAARSV